MIDERNKEIVPVMKRVNNYAARWLHNKFDRDDIVQVVMLKLLSAGRDISCLPEGYLYATTRNAVFDQFRNRWHQVKKVSFVDAIELDGAEDCVLSPSVGPIESDPFERQKINQALNGLSQAHREVVALKIQQFSDQEIADLLNLPIGTVKSRFHTARRHFKEKLACA